MKLLYRIDYIANLGYFKRVVEDLINRSNVTAVVNQYDGFILVTIDDEREAVERLFVELGQNLPYSIFLKKAYFVESFDGGVEIEQREAENLEPLTNYNVKEILSSVSDEQVTIDGVFEFGDMKLFVDLALIERFRSDGFEVRALVLKTERLNSFVVTKEDMRLLCSIEKPLVKLKSDELGGYIYARLVGSYDEVRLSKRLKNYDLLYYATKSDELKACSVSGVDLIVSDGNRLYPFYDRKRNINFANSSDYLSSFASVYDAVLYENSASDESSVGLYLSLDRSSYVGVRNGGSKRAISFLSPHYNTIDDLLSEIASTGSSAKRLIESFKERFMGLVSQTITPNDGLRSLFEMVCKVVGVEGLDHFEALALDGGYQNTLSIDMKIEKIDGSNQFNYKKALQSIISYKMAGVEDSMLAHSFYDQFAGFVASNTIEIAKVVGTSNVALCGDLLANRVIFKKIFKELGATHKILLPKQFALDFSRKLV